MSAEILKVQLTAPHDSQREILRESKRWNILECGRRYGKTSLGQWLAAMSAIDHHAPVGWFSPTYKSLAEVWREMTRTLQPLTVTKSETEKRIELLTGGSIDFWSLDNTDSGRGRKYKRVVIDEASIVRDLQEAWEQAIRPTLTDLRGDAWFLGTPKGRNFFHVLFQRGQDGREGWKSWRRGTADNPYMPADEIEEARRDLPDHVFRQEFEGVPADDGGSPFGIDAIRGCIGLMSTAEPVVVGVDLAKSVDWSVAIGLDRDGAVCMFERFQSPWQVTIERLKAAIGTTYAVVDSTGVGDPVLEALQKGAGNYEGFKFSSTSKQQIMEGLAVAIQRREVRFPEGVIQSELESFEYEYSRTGVRYNAPSGLHDDAVCALALAVDGWRRRSIPVVSTVAINERPSPWRM